MNDEKLQFIVGIPDKETLNDLQGYQQNVFNDQLRQFSDLIGKINNNQQNGESLYDIQIKTRIEDMKNHPQQFFNFGFTFEDFQAYLMKLMYCRALRKFIERKRLSRIQEYFKNNDVLFPMVNSQFQDQGKLDNQNKYQMKNDMFKSEEQDQ